MADLPEYEPFEGLYSSPALNRRRRVSYSSQLSSNSPLRLDQLRTQASTTSIRSSASSVAGHSKIHSPVPRRHLLLQTESQPQWLRDAILSPSPSNTEFSQGSRQTRSPSILSPVGSTQNAGIDARLKDLDVHKRSPAVDSSRSRHKSSRVRPSMQIGAGRRWIRWMHTQSLGNHVTHIVILAAVCIKWCVGLGGYSGAEKPPLYGDYEAQRHWMEITLHLPAKSWYAYDLQYWGLDYPPLTAYHSWLCGIIGDFFDPSWFALDHSRGTETAESKVFMRATVLMSEMALYVPAVLLFVRSWHRSRSKKTQDLAFITVMFQPALILIDSGHFQFNSVMLGFTVFALYFFSINRDVLGAICFVLSISFKQMALYYAPAIGCYLIGKCLFLGKSTGFRLFIRMGLTTVVSFYIVFIPFIPPFASFSLFKTTISRIFPLSRGLFEDKVSNFWCATDVIVKWRLRVSTKNLLRFSTTLTAIGFLPAVSGLLWSGYNSKRVSSSNGKEINTESVPTPMLPLLPFALLTSSMSFFLFSFMVHEKTILLPLLPLTLIMSGASTDSLSFQWIALVNNVATFSMWPLLKRDGQGIQYFACIMLWNWAVGHNPFKTTSKLTNFQLISIMVHIVIIVLHILEIVVDAPSRYPDLYAVLNMLISTPIFVLTWLWSMKRELEVFWALGGLQSHTVHDTNHYHHD